MKLALPRYIHGMLRTPDKRFVFGDLRPIAYSSGFSDRLQREVYEKARPGLNRQLLKESGIAYGFFPLNESDYVAACYQLMDLTEPTSRGKAVFSEYLYVTAHQLARIEWNPLPIFRAFSNINYYDSIVNDLAPVEIEMIPDSEWFGCLRRFPLQMEAILVRLLSSTQKINITSAPSELETQLQILCAIFQCLPERYKRNISFATLAGDTSDSVRVFFSPRPGGSGQIVDWVAPTIPNLPGAIYSNWVASLVANGNAQHLKSAIANLRIPIPDKSGRSRIRGDELDLAIRHREWYENKEKHLSIKVPEQLEKLLNQINEYSCLYDDQEVADWLSTILTYVMKLSAYDIGVSALSSNLSLLTQKDIRQHFLQQFITFLERREENISAVADFITQITRHAARTGQDVLIEFSQDILTSWLASHEYRKGLSLWAKIINLTWASSEEWFITALAALPTLQATDDFVYIVNDIGCPASKRAFASLFGLFRKSSLLTQRLPKTAGFLDIPGDHTVEAYLSLACESYAESKSYRWLSTQIRFASQHYANAPALLPGYLGKMDIREVDGLLSYVILHKHSDQVILVAFSLMVIGIFPDQSTDPSLFDKCISLCRECTSEDIELGLEALSGNLEHFSIEQLESLLSFLAPKSRNRPGIARTAEEVQAIIHHRKVVQRIQNLFTKKVTVSRLDVITQYFILEFIRAADTDAWALFIKSVHEKNYLGEYRQALVEVILNDQSFQHYYNQIQVLIPALASKNLPYEADLFFYWLISIGDSPVNIAEVLLRTLRLTSVPPVIAGAIIGHERSVDKKYARSLAKKLVKEDLPGAQTLIERLSEFVSRHPVNWVQIRIKSFVRNEPPEPGVVWIEFCKVLLRFAESEFQKSPSWRRR